MRATASPARPAPLLITGFEPFGGDDVNPSALVVRELDGATVAGAPVRSVCLPCVFGDAAQVLLDAVARHRPAVVVALGLAANRDELTPERVAINVDDARIACNAGRRPIDTPVVAGAPVAYFSTLPVKAIVAALRDAGLPASVSQTAGTFVCNHVFFALMHALRRRRGIRAGFMHLPTLDRMPLADQVRGARIALAVAATTAVDARVAGGAVS